MMHRRTTNLDHPVYPTHIVSALTDALVESGVPAEAALTGTGLDPSILHSPVARLAYRQIIGVLRNVVQRAAAPDVALRAGQRMHFAAYGVVGYTVLSSPSHSAAAERAIRFGRVVGPLCDLHFERDGQTAVWVYDPVFWPDSGDPLHRAAVEFHLASHQTILANLYGPGARVGEICVAYDAADRLSLYESFFGCPIRSSAPRNEFRYDATLMEAPMAYSDAATHAAVREMCERQLAEVLSGVGLAANVHRLLLDQPDGFPGVEQMAQMLSMHPRTLRRRLESEGTSYREIIAEVRKQMAITYLRTTSMKHEQIAARLGYSDAANFRHAFLRWTGRNPSEFRER